MLYKIFDLLYFKKESHSRQLVHKFHFIPHACEGATIASSI